MKQRRISYRKKKNKTIIEGKRRGKAEYIWTLPPPEILIRKILAKASFLPKEKLSKMLKKIQRLDYKEKQGSNPG